MLIKDSINIKQYYRFIEFSLKLMNKELTHERCKLICLDEYKCETEEEIKVKRYVNGFMYVLNNKKQVISKELLKDIYYLLNKETLEEEIVNKIIKIIYQDYDDNPHFIAARTHLRILDFDIKEKEKYAFLILNLIMLKKERNIVIFYQEAFETYKYIILKKDVYRLMFLLMQCEQKRVKNENINMPSLDSIIRGIKKLKLRLTNTYHIERIYLYGSITKGIITNQSDIDLLIKYKKGYLNIEKRMKYPSFRELIKKELNCEKIDFIDFTHACNNLEIGEMENIITLI